jgi:hypothetical protein
MPNPFPHSWAQVDKCANRPKITGGFALDKGLWNDREVMVVAISRGDLRRKTRRAIYYGTLILSGAVQTADGRQQDGNQIAVKGRDGVVHLIHKSRAVEVYDLTRTKASA